MGPMFSLFGYGTILVYVFLPVFIAGWIMLRSPGRAFALAVVFCAGALAAFVACGQIGGYLLVDADGRHNDWISVAFATVGAAGGGILAVWLLGKFTKTPPWRRN